MYCRPWKLEGLCDSQHVMACPRKANQCNFLQLVSLASSLGRLGWYSEDRYSCCGKSCQHGIFVYCLLEEHLPLFHSRWRDAQRVKETPKMTVYSAASIQLFRALPEHSCGRLCVPSSWSPSVHWAPMCLWLRLGSGRNSRERMQPE
eukprot:1061835-Amphidinium_carterae.2